MNYGKLEVALAAAFGVAIRSFGKSNFKKTSLFGSNERSVQQDELRKAA